MGLLHRDRFGLHSVGLCGYLSGCFQSPFMLRILHLEDDELDRELIDRALEGYGIKHETYWAHTAERFASVLCEKQIDLVLCDSGGPGFSGFDALALTRQLQPKAAFVYVTGHIAGSVLEELTLSGADGVVKKTRLSEMAQVLPCAFERRGRRYDG